MSDEKVTQLQDLPDEILLTVFKCTDKKDLLNSALVCKRWNEVIGNSSAVMRKLPVEVRSRSSLEVESFGRKYHTITIDGNKDLLYNVENDMLKTVTQLGPDLRVLELYNCGIEDGNIKYINKLFESLTKLETLKMYEVRFSDDVKFESITPQNLKSLKSVALTYTSCKILKFIEKTQLTSLKVDSGFLESVNFPDSLVNFLAAQENLEELELSQLDFCENNNIDVEKLKSIKFPLKKLSLDEIDEFFGTEENLLLFMNKFVNSLEELKIFNDFPESFYEMIFKNFLKLKTLRVDIDDAPKENAFYHNLRPNPSVKTLIIRSIRRSTLMSAQGIIGNLPNVSTLVLEDTFCLSQELMLFISINLRMLNSLDIYKISSQHFEGVNIPSLKSITIRNLPFIEKQGWKTIVKALPNIEVFKVRSFYNDNASNEQNFEIMSKRWKQLKHVKLGDGFEADKRIFDHLLRNCIYLKTVEVSEMSFKDFFIKEQILRDFKRDGLRFIIYPQDELFVRFRSR